MADADVKDDAPKQLGRIALKRRVLSAVVRPRDPVVRHAQLVALSERYGVPALDLDQVCIKTDDLGNVPRNLAQHHVLVPVLARPDRLFVAMRDPSQHDVIQEVEFVSGKRVYAYAAPAEDIAETIERAYLARERGELHFIGPSCPPETLRKAGLLPEQPAPSPADPIIPPAVELAGPDEAMMPMERVVVVENVRIGDSGPPATVSAYPPRLSSLPPALRSKAREPDVDLADVVSAVEQAFDYLFDEASAVHQLPDEADAAAPDTPRQQRILIVDDDLQTRELLTRVLAAEGHAVRVTEDGRQALRMIKEQAPDLLILSALLPEVHGFDIARRLHNSQRYGTLPIVMIGAEYRGWRMTEDSHEGFGVVSCIEKPLREEDIRQAVAAALGGSSSPIETPLELSQRAEQALAEGMAAYRSGDVPRAIAHLEQGVAIDPLAYRLHFHLGLLFAQQGQTYDAIRALERAVEINSRHFPGVKNLAIMYCHAGFRNRAVELWTRGLQLAPDDETRDAIREHLAGLLSQESLS
ncbi:MAG: response regulator [Microvirga sp.]